MPTNLSVQAANTDIDHDKATFFLNELLDKIKKNPQNYENCLIKTTIDFVNGAEKCLTYRYIMFTALLAKAMNENVNILCLQKNLDAQIGGTYDARSLCHKSVYPFQKSMLNDVIGGNGDPLVNNPGRYPFLDKQNATPKGSAAQQVLGKLVDELPLLDSSEKAYEALAYCIAYWYKKSETLKEESAAALKKLGDQESVKFIQFLRDLLDKGFNGAALVLVISTLMRLSLPDRFKVKPYPVNRTGKSSLAFADIGVFDGETPYLAIEAKDKPFGNNEIDKAVETANKDGVARVLFVAGKQSNSHEHPHTYYESLIKSYASQGIIVGIVYIEDMLDEITTVHSMDIKKISASLFEDAKTIRNGQLSQWIFEELKS